MKTVLYAHPWNGSFNNGILETVKKKLEEEKEKYTLIDLNRENFNPVLKEKDLSLYSKGEYTDPSVEKYQEILKDTKELILIFPIWWSSMPAVMKGFFDKVMLPGFAYENQKFGIKGLLGNIKEAKIITTAASPKLILHILGFSMMMKRGILGGIGIKKSKWLHCSFIQYNNDEKRKGFLEKVSRFI